jgi:predicted NBD/HSP70 family sugar kinase
MILAIDIGGTKTLVAAVDETGEIQDENKFATPKNYKEFLKTLGTVLSATNHHYSGAVVAAPGKVIRPVGDVEAFGNLSWKNVQLARDVKKLVGCPVVVENDANLAGLAEAHSLDLMPHRVLYVTISTGIGTGIITNGVIDPDFADSEGGVMLFEHNNKLVSWEDFASGRAIVKKYGKKASEINDPKVWDEIAEWFAVGIVNLTSVLDPDVIIIGGGVGTHFKKYEQPLRKYIEKLTPPVVSIVPIFEAKQPEQAVINGCVIYAKQHHEQ